MSEEWSRYYRRPGLHELEALHARFVRHSFARHSHDYYVVGYVEWGAQSYRYQRERHVTSMGEIFLVQPGEPHTGEAAAAEGYIYRTLYPRNALMRQAAENVGISGLPYFRRAVVRDGALNTAVIRFHRALAQGAATLEIESHLIGALTCLIAHHAEQPSAFPQLRTERATSRRAREYIEAHFDTDISLSRLAVLVDRSPFHFARAFANDVGVPPHVYLDMVRIRKARELLDRGSSIADAAVAVGYADQSHLTHRFKRLTGITPGQYAAAALC
jgi:AraC-like DNA-binding protein